MTPASAALVITCTTPGVVDGDTIACAGERVRLWGLDAPERHDPTGPAATRALARLTARQPVTCTEAGKRSYGRLVARCTLPDGRDLACEMIRGGWAREWAGYSRGYYTGCGR